MEYRSFNVRTWSFLCERTHMGVGAHQQLVSTFWLGKTHKFFIVHLTHRRGSNLGSLDLKSDALPTSCPKNNGFFFFFFPNNFCRSVCFLPVSGSSAENVHTILTRLNQKPRCCKWVARFDPRFLNAASGAACIDHHITSLYTHARLGLNEAPNPTRYPLAHGPLPLASARQGTPPSRPALHDRLSHTKKNPTPDSFQPWPQEHVT